MAQYVYTMNRVSKTVPPKRQILKDISLSFFPGAKIGVLGLNGAGKSTLLKIMAGLDRDIEGEARPQKDIRVGYLPQEPQLDPNKDVLGNVELGVAETKQLLDDFQAISMRFAEPMDDDTMQELLDKQAKLQNAIEAVDGWGLQHKLDLAGEALRLPPWDARVDTLSGGERRRVALCQLLLSNPDMLLLDEPTNHLDADSVAWLEQFLQNFSGTIVAVTHDRYFLDNVAEWILELDRGHGIPWHGNYSSWLSQKEQRLAQEEKQSQQRKRAIEQELAWVNSNPKGRTKKSKARLAEFETLTSKSFQQRQETLELYIPPGERLGDQVIEVHNLCKRFDNKVLYQDLSFTIPKGAIVGVIGPNGAGKTTLFNLLTQQIQPDSGDIIIGQTVQIACVSQHRDTFAEDKTVWEEVSDGLDMVTVGKYSIPSRAYIGRFNFKGQDQQKFVKDLSGGERNRLHLAKLLKQGANVLLLDEPTNDLDVETLRALEEALLNFPGCAIITSHDRWFLDRIATHILNLEGEETMWFTGNYQEYEAYRQKTLGDAAATPKRMRYIPIES